MNRRVWECKIGGPNTKGLPSGADFPMRQAISRAYKEITGESAEFCFSGWGGSLDEVQLAVVENRAPKDEAGPGVMEVQEFYRKMNPPTPKDEERPPRNWDCEDGYIGCQRIGKHRHECSGPCQEATPKAGG